MPASNMLAFRDTNGIAEQEVRLFGKKASKGTLRRTAYKAFLNQLDALQAENGYTAEQMAAAVSTLGMFPLGLSLSISPADGTAGK